MLTPHSRSKTKKRNRKAMTRAHAAKPKRSTKPRKERVTFAEAAPATRPGTLDGLANYGELAAKLGEVTINRDELAHDLERVQTENDALHKRLDTPQNRRNFGDYFCYAVFAVILFAIAGLGAGGFAIAAAVLRSFVSSVPSWLTVLK